MLEGHNATSQCEGIGVVIPGVVDSETGRVLNAPVDTEKPVRTENTGFGSVREIIIVSRSVRKVDLLNLMMVAR